MQPDITIAGNLRTEAKVAEADAQKIVDEFVRQTRAPRVLEAGCGSTTYLKLPGDSYLVGIDISAAQLERDTRLQKKIEGDLQLYDFGSEQFDIILCWNVLEHLSDPASAVENMARALAPNGLLIIAVPNLWSIKGLMTRFTPFFVHLWFYRLMGDRRPASEMDQFPTFLRRAMTPGQLTRQGVAQGLRVRFFRTFEGLVQHDMRSRTRLADYCFAAIGPMSTSLSGGRIDLSDSDAIVILQRPV